MSTMKNYDPQRVIITFRGVHIQGYAEGVFIKAGRYNPTFKHSVGAGGDVVRVRDRNRMGSAEVTLQAASSSNDFLQGFLNEDEADGTGAGEFQMLDGNGSTLIHAETAWIEKPADVERGSDNSNSVWVIVMADMEIKNGGYVL